jgi:hypothetical protein
VEEPLCLSVSLSKSPLRERAIVTIDTMSKYHDEDWKNLPEDVQEAGELIRFSRGEKFIFCMMRTATTQ